MRAYEILVVTSIGAPVWTGGATIACPEGAANCFTASRCAVVSSCAVVSGCAATCGCAVSVGCTVSDNSGLYGVGSCFRQVGVDGCRAAENSGVVIVRLARVGIVGAVIGIYLWEHDDSCE